MIMRTSLPNKLKFLKRAKYAAAEERISDLNFRNLEMIK